MRSTITPYGRVKIYRPNKHINQKNLFVIPGFAESITHNKKLVDTLSAAGWDAYTFSQPRKFQSNPYFDPLERQADVLLFLLKLTAVTGTKVHAVAHSLGSGTVLKAARKAPEIFESITIMQPSGMTYSKNRFDTHWRILRKVFSNQFRLTTGANYVIGVRNGFIKESRQRLFIRIFASQITSLYTLIKNPQLAYRETLAASQYDITTDLEDVFKLDIPVHFVISQNDELFDESKVAKNLECILPYVTSHKRLSGRDAVHDSFWIYPERTKSLIKNIIG